MEYDVIIRSDARNMTAIFTAEQFRYGGGNSIYICHSELGNVNAKIYDDEYVIIKPTGKVIDRDAQFC